MNKVEKKKITKVLETVVRDIAKQYNVSDDDLYDICYDVSDGVYNEKRNKHVIIPLKEKCVGKFFKYYEWDEHDDKYASYLYITNIFYSGQHITFDCTGLSYEHGDHYDNQYCSFDRFIQKLVLSEGDIETEAVNNIMKHFVEITEEEFFNKVEEESKDVVSNMRKWILSVKKNKK